MKLVEIKDVRENQVWISDNDERKYLVIDNKDNNDYLFFDKFFNYSVTEHNLYDIDKYKLIGFVGITHKFDDGKLLEIPRNELEKDDIIQINDELGVLFEKKTNKKKEVRISIITNHSFLTFPENCKGGFKKLGTLGVTHEFINENLED
jgi:hypothetical protein